MAQLLQRRSNAKVYLIAGAAALIMGGVTYWMYSDSEKAAKLVQEKKAEKKSTKQKPKEDGLATQGATKLTTSFKSILDNPLQSRTPAGAAQTQLPPAPLPQSQTPQPSGESYYHDAK